MLPILFQTPEFSFGEDRFGISFYSCASPTNHLRYRVRLSEDDEVDIRIDFGIYAYDVNRFLTQVEALHQTLQGTASLQALDSRDEIVISVGDAGSGRLVISGRLASISSGIRVEFDGFQGNQSYLPSFLSRMREFFREAAVDISVYF